MGRRAQGHKRPPAGRASGPTTRRWPPAAGATRPGPSAAPGWPQPRRPIAPRRQPDRARLVQVVRLVRRSTWTRRARPGRAELARRDASTGRTPGTLGRNLGDDLAIRTAARRPKQTNPPLLTSTFAHTYWSLDLGDAAGGSRGRRFKSGRPDAAQRAYPIDGYALSSCLGD